MANINGRATGSRAGNINGRPSKGSPSRTYTPASLEIAASVENATTSPKAIWASQDRYLAVEPGGTISETAQFIATRVKMNIAGGRWAKLALVYAGAYQKVTSSPTGIMNTARVTVSSTFELANGSLQTTYLSSNASSTAPFQVTFNNSVDAILVPGDVMVSDWIYPADLGLTVFEWTDRTLLPWVRTAYSKTGATDLMGMVSAGGGNQSRTEYNYPSNSHVATCTTYATAKTLILQTGIVNYNGGSNTFSSTDGVSAPGPIGIIGEGLDGQVSILFFGTSILDGDGDTPERQGGVNPTNNSMYNYDMVGFPSRWSQKLTNSTPSLNLACGASSMFEWFSNDAANNWAATDNALTLSKLMIAKFAQWFDICIANDVHNDSVGTYQDTLYQFTRIMRSQNQSLKIYGAYMPNGYVDITGATVAYDTGLDVRWTAQAAMVTAGYWDGMLNMRGDATKLFLDSGTQVTSTTTALGTTTTLIDTGQAWRINQWANSWVEIAGVKKLISANTATTLTFAAYGGAIASATAYLILGNQTGDGTHPNAFMQRTVMPAKFDTELSAAGISVPRFTRTQS